MAQEKTSPLDDAIENGLITGNTDTREALERSRQWLLVEELKYTKIQVEGDVFTPFIRGNRRN